MTIIIISTVLTLAYTVLMLAYHKGWKRQREFVLPQSYEPATRISIIIPARNEEANIGACLDAIYAQKYPQELLEVIVVDDHSTDATAAVVGQYADRGVICVPLAAELAEGKTLAYKKAALAAGIARSTGTLIVTTDADCVAPNTWLAHIAGLYEQQQPAMIVGPVTYHSVPSVVGVFQLTDFVSMQGITAAAHELKLGNMSNGANLAFSRQAYDAVGGYMGIDHMASGDDYLLMHKMMKAKAEPIAYLHTQHAIVRTLPQPDWKSFLQQRIRWASKSGKYGDVRLTLILLLVYLFNAGLLALAIAGFADAQWWYLAVAMLVAKVAAEAYFLRPVASFYKVIYIFRYFVLLQPLHVLYIVLAGFLGFFGSYSWKGRTVK